MNKVEKLRYTITRDCPFDCYYCHNEGMGKKSSEDNNQSMNSDDFLFFCRLLKEVFGLEQVTLTGGDPYMARNILEVGQGLKQNGLYSRIISRGAPLLNILKKRKSLKTPFDCYVFSIETLNKKKFERVTRVSSKFLEANIEALKILKSQGKHVEINATITPDTEAKDIRELLNFARSEQVSEIRLYEVMDPNKIKEPYLEKILFDAGIIDNPNHISPLSIRSIVEDDGTKVVIRRCACNMAIFEQDLKYCMESPSMTMDSQGRINMCLFLDVHSNPETISVLNYIKNRDSDKIIECIREFKPIRKCPLLYGTSTVNLGKYH